MKQKTLLKTILHPIFNIFSNLHWNSIRALFNDGIYYDLTEVDHDALRKLLAKGNFIILTYRKSHFTTYLIGIASVIKNGKWPSYSHALMNVDNIINENEWYNYKLIEATGTGVHWSTFMQVFDCDHVCILKPKNLSVEDWSNIMEKLLKQQGKKYDDLFDLSNDKQVSCVELCRVALQADSDYSTQFADFERMIDNIGNLTPQMYRDCLDFEPILEIKR